MVNYIGYVWFNGRSCIGIVLTHNEETDELKAYIERGHEHDEFTDIEYIMEWGSFFPVPEAISLILKYGIVSCPMEEFVRLTSPYDTKNSNNSKPNTGNGPTNLVKD